MRLKRTTGTREAGGSAPADTGLQLVLESALDAAVVMTADGAITAWNSRAESVFGWSKAEAIGRQLVDLIIPVPLRTQHQKGLAHYRATGEGPYVGQRVETTGLHRDGREFPIEVSVSPLARDGETSFLGFLRDISERKRTEASLEARARRAMLLHQLSSFAAQSASVEDALRQCLSAVCEMIGWPVGHAYLPTPREPYRLISSVWHCPPGKYEVLRTVTEAMGFGPGIGLPGQVWDLKEPVWLSDVTQSDNFPRAHVGQPIEVHSAFGFPIKSGDQVIAVLEFFNEEITEPDNAILMVSRALGDQVGRVLERKLDAERQHTLLAELNHRVKNMLAVVVGIATQTARSATSLPAFQESFTGRLMSLSRTYSLMTSAQWQRTSLKDLISEMLLPHADSKSLNITIDGPPVTLTPKITLTMSMLLHELLTNAMKHGALSVPGGRIEMGWRFISGDSGTALLLIWRELGRGQVTPPQKPGFGLRLIETSVRHELRGQLETVYGAEGVEHTFTIPWQEE
jgi:PAS domain S-box-containing protein